ncbi:DNA topoisomerase 2-like [Aegilops tauschii subsp. strangulata]|uniref:DNA topoisomerase (ATP-hydrolyzing) n=1 Tax=Aegilops tauschii TaxID=37682 RepID=M8B245_AEGTA
MKLHTVKGYLWVFVNVLIDNPAFDLQTKETLITHQGSFGSKCELSEDFLNKVSNSGVISNLLNSVEFRLSKELNKTDGSKRTSFLAIHKLEDAYDAGGRDSEKCTLILTERDSAKAFADHDGSHIKGLLLNFIHSSSPSLLKVPSFLVEFITPIIKITNNMSRSVNSFYSMPNYEAWKEKLGGNSSLWSIKYYKELGTCTTQEGREYFEDIDHHKKDFVWADDKDGECIELLFSKERIAGRKEWQHIKYSDFINKELILFPMADLASYVPSMVDGLKRGQRKVLFCSFKRNFVEEAFVTELIGYASEHSAYRSTPVGCHAWSASIAALPGLGKSPARSPLLARRSEVQQLGGKDAGSTKDLYTRLPPVTRLIFPKDDDILLNYLNEDGQSIEPSWYMPVIPMVLVNGSEDMGTGYVPNYNPRDIIANLKRMLNKEPVIPMDPWYKGFQGSLTKTRSKETGVTYTITGVIEEVDCRKLHITELPVRCWTVDYEHFLKSICPHKEKEKGKGMDKDKEPPFLEGYRSRCSHADVYFKVILSEQNMNVAKKEGLEKKFKLITTIGTTMYLFDSHGTSLSLTGRLLELKRKEYPPFPEKKPIEEIIDNRLAEAAAGVNASDYHYLFVALFTENVPDLIAQQEKLEGELESLLNTEPEILWLRDLDALEKELDVLDAKFEAQQEQRRYEHQHIFSEGAKASTTAPRIQPEKATANSQKANLSVGDNEEHAATFLTAAQNKKPPKKASAPVRDDDEGSPALRDCLAASILPEPSAMEAQTKEELQKGKNEPSQRHASEKAMPSLTEFSEEDMEGEDEEFPMEVEKETIGGKAAAEMPKTAIRKRVPAERQGMRHKVMEEIFKPTDDSSGASPEKKRRCKR